MTHALTLTIPIKQDEETQQKLQELKAGFSATVQPVIEEALKNSKIVHFARVVVIDDKYIQVITEYEGAHHEYAEFFRLKLPKVFEAIFNLADNPPDINDPNAFLQASIKYQVRALGDSADGVTDFLGQRAGYLFSAYDYKDVKTILAALKETPATAST